MKRVCLAAAALVVWASAAGAADVAAPVYKAPAYVAPNWTGFYVGGEIGYLAGRVDSINIPTGATFSAKPEGAIGGVFAGYDYQMPNNWVVGVRVAAPVFSSAKDTLTDPFFPFVTYEAKIRYAVLGTVQLGYSMGNWMPYVGVGGGFAGGRGSVAGTLFPDTVDKTHAGFAANAGVKYLLTKNWFVGVQYTYTKWSSETYAFSNGFSTGVGSSTNSLVFQAGYKF